MSTGQDTETYDVNVFIKSCLHDHIRGLPDTSVYDFHAGITEGPGNDLGTSVMAIKAWFGYQDAYDIR